MCKIYSSHIYIYLFPNDTEKNSCLTDQYSKHMRIKIKNNNKNNKKLKTKKNYNIDMCDKYLYVIEIRHSIIVHIHFLGHLSAAGDFSISY